MAPDVEGASGCYVPKHQKIFHPSQLKKPWFPFMWDVSPKNDDGLLRYNLGVRQLRGFFIVDPWFMFQGTIDFPQVVSFLFPFPFALTAMVQPTTAVCAFLLAKMAPWACDVGQVSDGHFN